MCRSHYFVQCPCTQGSKVTFVSMGRYSCRLSGCDCCDSRRGECDDENGFSRYSSDAKWFQYSRQFWYHISHPLLSPGLTDLTDSCSVTTHEEIWSMLYQYQRGLQERPRRRTEFYSESCSLSLHIPQRTRFTHRTESESLLEQCQILPSLFVLSPLAWHAKYFIRGKPNN